MQSFSDDDPFVQQELFTAKAGLYLAERDFDNAEKILKQAYELNPFVFAPVLGRFYAYFRSFKEALPVLDKVGVILERYAAGTIEIEGHTDNVPISTSRFASNNELSSARAISVFNYLLSVTNLDPAHIKNAGRGEYVPIADNSTEEGRQKNRRVEIRIYNEISSQN